MQVTILPDVCVLYLDFNVEVDGTGAGAALLSPSCRRLWKSASISRSFHSKSSIKLCSRSAAMERWYSISRSAASRISWRSLAASSKALSKLAIFDSRSPEDVSEDVITGSGSANLTDFFRAPPTAVVPPAVEAAAASASCRLSSSILRSSSIWLLPVPLVGAEFSMAAIWKSIWPTRIL